MGDCVAKWLPVPLPLALPMTLPLACPPLAPLPLLLVALADMMVSSGGSWSSDALTLLADGCSASPSGLLEPPALPLSDAVAPN
jgi:hypothetical protein